MWPPAFECQFRNPGFVELRKSGGDHPVVLGFGGCREGQFQTLTFCQGEGNA